MSADISDFVDTINALRYHHARPDLAKMIAAKEPMAKQSAHFLIKMEIKRLAQPITRVIDLRQTVKVACEAKRIAGITHYLDATGVEDFESELARYKGVYCMGVHEFVVNRAVERNEGDYERQLVDKLPDPELLSLTAIYQRRDERMYFASQVALFDKDPTGLEKDERKALRIDAITTDLSENGLTIKLDVDKYKPLPYKFVQFVALEREYVLSAPLFAKYKRLRSDVKGDKVYLSLELVKDQDPTTLEQCRDLVRTCIANHKRRNRVDVDNTVAAVFAKIHEQFVMGKLNRLPLFFSQSDGGWRPEVGIKSPYNEALLNFFSVQGQPSVLSTLCQQAWIQSAIDDPSLNALTVFALRFRDKHKNVQFAVFDYTKATVDPFILNLLKKGIKQGGVRLLRLYTCSIDPQQSAHIPSSLPDSAGEVFANLNRPPTAKLTSMVVGLKRLVVLGDISGLLPNLEVFQSGLEDVPPSSIKANMVRLGANVKAPYMCELEKRDTRLEDRFDMALPLRMRLKGQSKEDSHLVRTVNVSSKGLKVTVDPNMPFKEGDEVVVDLRLPFEGKDQVMQNQPYSVVERTEQAVHLAIRGDAAAHNAREALRDLINANLEKVQTSGSSEPVYGHTRAIRNMFASNHINLAAVTFRKGADHYVKTIIKSEQTPELQLHETLSEADGFNLMCKNLALRKLLIQKVNALGKSQDSLTVQVFVVARKKRQASPVTLVVKPLDSEEGQTMEQIYANLRSFGKPLLLQFTLMSKDEFFDKYVRDEMRYLTRFAKSKLDECQELINHVTSVVEIQNLTDLLVEEAESPPVLI